MDFKIGEIIKDIFDSKDIKLKDFAEEIGVARQNIYRIFEKDSIDTELLLKISQVLNHNFFQYFLTTQEKLKQNTISESDQKLLELKKEIEILKNELNLSKKEIDYLKKIIELMEERTKLLFYQSKHSENENGKPKS